MVIPLLANQDLTLMLARSKRASASGFFQNCIIANLCLNSIDIPECLEQKDACGERAICTEIPGSYNCRCPKGFHFGNRKRDCFRKYQYLYTVKFSIA